MRGEALFRARLAELGATLLEPEWLGARTPHRVRCAAGHDCAPWPASVNAGQGVCKACAAASRMSLPYSRGAAARFREHLSAAGAVLVEPAWLGARKPHRVICAAGHDCAPTPDNTRKGQGICLACIGKSPAAAEIAFRARLAELGATLLEPEWLGVKVPHRARCARGHVIAPRPDNVINGGRGVCRLCFGKWDVFYVVVNPDAGRVKLGITSGDPRGRLAGHKTDGYRQVVMLLTGLPPMVAPELESAALAALTLAGLRPVRGREYFDLSALPVALDVAGNYPVPGGVS